MKQSVFKTLNVNKTEFHASQRSRIKLILAAQSASFVNSLETLKEMHAQCHPMNHAKTIYLKKYLVRKQAQVLNND